jgi:hypothetical protein
MLADIHRREEPIGAKLVDGSAACPLDDAREQVDRLVVVAEARARLGAQFRGEGQPDKIRAGVDLLGGEGDVLETRGVGEQMPHGDAGLSALFPFGIKVRHGLIQRGQAAFIQQDADTEAHDRFRARHQLDRLAGGIVRIPLEQKTTIAPDEERLALRVDGALPEFFERVHGLFVSVRVG